MADIPIMRDYDSLDTLSGMSEGYNVAHEALFAWKNDETKLNQENMNKLRNAISELQKADTIVNNNTIKMLWQLLDELVGQRIKTAGYTEVVDVNDYMNGSSNVNDGNPLQLTKPGAPEIFNDYEDNSAVSPYSHAEGLSTDAGDNTTVAAREVAQLLSGASDVDTSMLKGLAAHSEGAHTCAQNDFSHAEGLASRATGVGSHAEGCATFSKSNIKVITIDGIRLTVDSTDYDILVENFPKGTLIRVKDCHAIVDEVEKIIDTVPSEPAEGSAPDDNGTAASAEGNNTQPSINEIYQLVLRYPISAVIDKDKEPDVYIVDSGSQATGEGSHAEGINSVSSGKGSHSEGVLTRSSGEGSHSEGIYSKAVYWSAHAEGFNTEAKEKGTHSEGINTLASGVASHAEGQHTFAYGVRSHAEGCGTIANGDDQHVQGRYNETDTENKYAHIIGNGTDVNHPSNAHTVDWDGNAKYAGNVEVPEGKDFKVGETLLLQKVNTEIANRIEADKQLIGSTDDNIEADTINGAKNYAYKLVDDLLRAYILDDNDKSAVDKLTEIATWLAGQTEDDSVTEVLNRILSLENNKLNRSDAVGTFYVRQSNGQISGEVFNNYEDNEALGKYSHSEGSFCSSHGFAAHSEGYRSWATGEYSHAEGGVCLYGSGYRVASFDKDRGIITTSYKHAVDDPPLTPLAIYVNDVRFDVIKCDPQHDYLEDTDEHHWYYNIYIDLLNVTEGSIENIYDKTIFYAENTSETLSSGYASHAEGAGTIASGRYSHAQGFSTVAEGEASHSEGYNTKALGIRSHAEGEDTISDGWVSHAEGSSCKSRGNCSHAEGAGTVANNHAQHVQGEHNLIDDAGSPYDRGRYAHILGNGTSNNNRSNAHTVDWNGNAWYQGDVYVGGSGQDDTTTDNNGYKLCRRVPRFYSGTQDPRTLQDFGSDGDIYILYTEE